MQPRDLYRLRVLGSPAIGIDGTAVVSVQRAVDESGYACRLWVFDGSMNGRTITPCEGRWSEVGPRFCPDGSRNLAFVSDRGGRRQAWLHSFRAGTSMVISEVSGDVRELAWLGPDRLLAVVDKPPEACRVGKPAIISWLRYKRDGRRAFVDAASELWALGIRGSGEKLRHPEGHIGAIATQGTQIAYSLTPLYSDVVEDAAQVWVLDVDNGRSELLWECPTPVEGLAFGSSDGDVIVVTAGNQSPFPRQRGVWILRRGNAPEELFSELDTSFEYAVQGDARHTELPARIVCLRERNTVVLAATVGMDVVLFEGDLGTNEVRRLSPHGACVTDFAALDGHIAMCLEAPDHPTELFTAHLGSFTEPMGAVNQVSYFNDEWLEGAKRYQPVAVEVKSRDGVDLNGLLYVPEGSGPHPVIVRVHGGPHFTSGYSFNFEAQVEVAAGFAVVLPNLRGSAGWGQKFRSLVVGVWGDRDYSDLMAFVDCVLSEPYIDATRASLAGGSYAGYLVNWAVTKTDRFRTAISERSISNLVSKYGTSDNGFLFTRNEFNGIDLFDEGIHELIERSPIRHAAAIRTPMLLIHGEADQRCPIEQSEQMFVALRRLGIEATFVRFAGESHEFTSKGRPDHRVCRLEIIVSWLKRHS